MKTCLKWGLALTLASPGAYATSSGDSVNQAANTTAANNNAGSQAAQQVGNQLAQQSADQASKCSPQNQQACDMSALLAALSLLSMLQAGAHGDSAGQAVDTATDTSASGTATGTLTTASASGSSIGNSPALDKLSKGINGVSVNPTKATVTSNGKTYSAADLGSASGMAAQGFSASEIGSAMAAAKAAEKDALEKVKLGALTPASGFGDGGGGGGGGDMLPPPSDEGGGGVRQAYSAPKAAPTPNYSTPKDFHGDPIGSADDSLFKMIARRYHFKDEQNAFIDEHDLRYKFQN